MEAQVCFLDGTCVGFSSGIFGRCEGGPSGAGCASLLPICFYLAMKET